MAKIEITVNGKAYPCRQTMGAMLRFKQETGKEVTGIGDESLSDMCTFLWCCVVSACKADGVEFGLSLMEFADSLAPDELAGWVETARADGGADGGAADEAPGGEKKNKHRRGSRYRHGLHGAHSR